MYVRSTFVCEYVVLLLYVLETVCVHWQFEGTSYVLATLPPCPLFFCRHESCKVIFKVEILDPNWHMVRLRSTFSSFARINCPSVQFLVIQHSGNYA